MMDINYTSCSDLVDTILHADVMKSVAYLVPDLLTELPILLYQGMGLAQACIIFIFAFRLVAGAKTSQASLITPASKSHNPD